MYQAGTATQTGNTNHSAIGDLARVDPEAAAKKILAVHKKHGGNSARAADELGIYYQTLRGIVVRLSAPLVMPKEDTPRTIAFDVGDKTGLTLEAAIVALRKRAKDPAAAKEKTPTPAAVRKAIDALVDKRGATLSAIAGAVDIGDGRTLDEGMLSKFRSNKKSLNDPTIRKLMAAVKTLDAQKDRTYEKRGRKATKPSS